MPFMLYTPLSSNAVSLFLKNSFPPSLGSMILKTALRQNDTRKSFPGLPFARITHILGLFIAPGIWSNRWEKYVFLVYASSLEALFAILCSTACILHDIFTFSQCFRHHFAEKWTLLSEVTSHKYVKANTASKICRTGVAMISLSWSRRLWTAYCLQYDVVYVSPWCLHLGVPVFELHTACKMICCIHVAMTSSSWSRRF